MKFKIIASIIFIILILLFAPIYKAEEKTFIDIQKEDLFTISKVIIEDFNFDFNYPIKNEAPIPEEYLNAATIWYYLKYEFGFSDAVAAGILGNMMAEAGGQTLYLQWWLGDYYYGICQWSPEYYPEAIGADLIQQLHVLNETIEREFNDFGEVFGYTYKDFLLIEDECEAALLFAQVYERCLEESWYDRQLNATAALRYFEPYSQLKLQLEISE